VARLWAEREHTIVGGRMHGRVTVGWPRRRPPGSVRIGFEIVARHNHSSTSRSSGAETRRRGREPWRHKLLGEAAREVATLTRGHARQLPSEHQRLSPGAIESARIPSDRERRPLPSQRALAHTRG
jgi:hypothetical protein